MSEKIILNRREHFIPQFILNNFCFDGTDKTYFYSTKDKKLCKEYIREIFMEMNLYDSDTKDHTNPRQLEEDFGKYENEISKLLKEKIFGKEEVILTFEEEASLKLFFILMMYRSSSTKNFFNNISEKSQRYYSQFQPDGNYNAFWKRNLGYLVKCRSFDQVNNHKNIDKPIKVFIQRDLVNVYGSYLGFIQKRGDIDFVISDSYPFGYIAEPSKIPVINYFVLSPSLMMAIVNLHAYEYGVLKGIDKKMTPPKIINNKFVYTTRKLYRHEIIEINKNLFNESLIGVVFKNKNTYEYFINS